MTFDTLPTPVELNRIYHADALTLLKAMDDASVQTIVTSPPYFGLRDYGADGQIGLEPTPQAYVAALVKVFTEARRVLRDDGTIWLNLGDSYAGSSATGWTSSKEGSAKRAGRMFAKSGGLPDLFDCLHTSVKEGVLFFGTRCALTVTAHRDGVLKADKVAPDGKFTRLFGVKRVLLKQRDNNLCQVLNWLNSEAYAVLSVSVRFRMVDSSTLEIITDELDNLSIVVSDLNLNSKSALPVSVGSSATERADVSLTVEESGKPVPESVSNVQSIGYPFTLNTTSESVLNVDAVDQSIALGNALVSNVQGLRDFSIRKATQEEFALTLLNGRVNLAVQCVGHLFVSNSFGSLVRYVELYDKAERKANTLKPKQELGIPELVKRGLMEDGWICRSTIIWSKPNAMPESVTDRPTKAHEYIFLLSKQTRYYYDGEAIKEPAQDWGERDRSNGKYTSGDVPIRGGKHHGLKGTPKQDALGKRTYTGFNDRYFSSGPSLTRNKRSVWTVSTKPYADAHFATFPPELIEPCILAGAPVGGVVLDCFMGSGTTALVARQLGRQYVGCDLNRDYVLMARDRLRLPFEPRHVKRDSDLTGLPLFDSAAD